MENIMNNKRKTWSLKDSNYAWRSTLIGVSNEEIARDIGRTPAAVSVHLSNRRMAVINEAKITVDSTPQLELKSVPVVADTPKDKPKAKVAPRVSTKAQEVTKVTTIPAMESVLILGSIFICSWLVLLTIKVFL